MCCLLSSRGEHWDDYIARRNQNYSQNSSAAGPQQQQSAAVGPGQDTGNQYRTELD